MNVNLPIWIPDEQTVQTSAMKGFRDWCSYEHRIKLDDHSAFHDWSVEDMGDFWRAVWNYCDVIGEPGPRSLINGSDMLAARFFPEGRLNFARNLLRAGGDTEALVFRGEDKVEYRWSWDHLKRVVSQVQQALRSIGVKQGDRIAAMLPNLPETVACMLAATSIGAVWSSCSPDFGVQGVVDRFGQIEPSLFIACDAYWYAGKKQDVAAKVRAVAAELGCPSVIVHYAGDAHALAASIEGARTLEDFVGPWQPTDVEYLELPFSHPLYILFSSGTTGVPKCIVHSAGGTLLQHLKEHRFHSDIRKGDRVFYFTTCGWMMWNWLVSALASNATLLLYDGSPFHPDEQALWSYVEAEGVTFFGTSAKYLDSLRKSAGAPPRNRDLKALRFVASTGSPLSRDSFEYVYREIKADVQLSSMSGGTDIVSCFVLGDPTREVWRGEITGPGLGMAVDVWSDEGRPLRGQKGELVCTKPFPSMPLGFWNDPDRNRFTAAYFEKYGSVWNQGDLAEWTAHGGIVIHGRSDATLNPGGVRIGTAEIYNQVEQLDEVQEALCVGQQFSDDVRIVLFVRLREGIRLDPDLEQKVRKRIREGASPRHVPAKIVQVSDIPRTKSGKIVELAVREVIHGRPVKNIEVLANPEALGQYANLSELAS